MGIERARVVADERRRVDRGSMILAAKRLAIEEPEPTLLAGPDQELAPVRIEGHRRRVHVEVAAPEPVRVRRAEEVDQLQLLVGVELYSDDGVAEPLGLRIELRIPRSDVDPALWIDRGAAAPPQSAASWNEGAGTA